MENADLHIILRRHVSHDVRIASYGDPRPVVQLVCFTCDVVVMSADQPSDPDKRPRRDLIGGSLVETTRGTAKLRRAYTPLKAFRTRSGLAFTIHEVS